MERCQQTEAKVGAAKSLKAQIQEVEPKLKESSWELLEMKIATLEIKLPDAVAKGTQFLERASDEEQ